MESLHKYVHRIRSALVPSGTIAEQAIKSGLWSTLINIVDRVLQLVKLVVLANLLAPADFGLMGIALLTLAVFRKFSNLGVDDALIQQEEENIDKYLNTAWSLKIGRGLALTLLVFIVAPYVAAFFNEPRTADIIRVIAISPLLLGLQNPAIVYLKKDLEFHKQFVYTICGTLVAIVTAIGYALINPSVWALVFGALTGNGTKVLISYYLHGYRPWPAFNRDFAGELFGYGKWLMLFSIIIFLNNQGDDAFVGWFLGTTALGFYQMAYRLSNAPATEISHVVSDVLFPTYSKMQQNSRAIQKGYSIALTSISAIVFPIAAGIIVVAQPFVLSFMGRKWIPIVTIIQILAIFGLFRALGATTGSLFRAIGRPDYMTKTAFINFIYIVLFIYPVTARWGLVGTALVITLRPLFSLPLLTYFVTKSIDINLKRLFHAVVYPLVASMLMGLIVHLVQVATIIQPLFEFSISVIVGIIIYLLCIYIFNRFFGYQLDETLKSINEARST